MKMRVSSLMLPLLFTGFLLVSCTKCPYHELLAAEEGKYSVLYVGIPAHEHLNAPELFEKVSSEKLTGYKLMWNIENAKRDYPELELESAPVFVIFDTKGVVFKTEDEQEAIEFFITDQNEQMN